jgi:hypothetical protein
MAAVTMTVAVACAGEILLGDIRAIERRMGLIDPGIMVRTATTTPSSVQFEISAFTAATPQASFAVPAAEAVVPIL